ncbi:hypothetical protein EU513_03260 [Yimella sp. RIT 621]|nr:hypothetical protein EU513_03260 [Yimella sp. RIT 621]
MITRVPFNALPLDQSEVFYEHGPDSSRQPGVVPGRTIALTIDGPAAFPGTTRGVWIHVPAGLRVDCPVRVTIFCDGAWYLDPAGDIRAGIVLDNLVAAGVIPPQVGVFVDPGVFPDAVDEDARRNRNAEYDADGPGYADFLRDEVLPRVRDHVTLGDDPRDRALCGGSSGGNACFTAAWHRPEEFARVVAFSASFAQMPGGNPYPVRIAREPRKALRVFLVAEHRDLQWNEPRMNWFAESLETAAALARKGYDVRLVLGDAGHGPRHGGVLLPDALRWVWREDPGPTR